MVFRNSRGSKRLEISKRKADFGPFAVGDRAIEWAHLCHRPAGRLYKHSDWKNDEHMSFVLCARD